MKSLCLMILCFLLPISAGEAKHRQTAPTNLPPGLQKQIRRNGQLPRGQRKRKVHRYRRPAPVDRSFYPDVHYPQ